MIAASFSVLADHGRFLEMGKIGIWDEARVRDLNASWVYRPFDLARVLEEDEALIVGMFGKLLAAFEDGLLKPLPYVVFPLARRRRLRFMRSPSNIGKVGRAVRTTIAARRSRRADCCAKTAAT